MFKKIAYIILVCLVTVGLIGCGDTAVQLSSVPVSEEGCHVMRTESIISSTSEDSVVSETSSGSMTETDIGSSPAEAPAAVHALQLYTTPVLLLQGHQV